MNPRLRLAIALKYKHLEDAAPKVIASGQGFQADRILDLAEANQIPVHQDPLLAQGLSDLPPGRYIPPELYAAVAEVLAMLMRMDSGLRNSYDNVTFAGLP